MKKITVRYFSQIGPGPGTRATPYETSAATVRELLHEIQRTRALPLTTNISKGAVNGAFVDWEHPVADGDTVTLLPPFSGG